jgi:hypothetical protein
MASGLLSVDALPEALQTLLLRRAEGNPFFLEELLRSCQETGMIRHEGVRLVVAPKLGESVLPDTIQDLIRARIERLGADPRQVLDVAAVVGREFLRRALCGAAPPGRGERRVPRRSGRRRAPQGRPAGSTSQNNPGAGSGCPAGL